MLPPKGGVPSEHRERGEGGAGSTRHAFTVEDAPPPVPRRLGTTSPLGGGTETARTGVIRTSYPCRNTSRIIDTTVPTAPVL
jgi:hypothetical protein